MAFPGTGVSSFAAVSVLALALSGCGAGSTVSTGVNGDDNGIPLLTTGSDS